MPGEMLAELFSRMKTPETETTDLVNGIVISTAPLKIRIEGEKSFEVPESKILLHRSCANLETGDNLRILRCNRGQTFYVLESFEKGGNYG